MEGGTMKIPCTTCSLDLKTYKIYDKNNDNGIYSRINTLGRNRMEFGNYVLELVSPNAT